MPTTMQRESTNYVYFGVKGVPPTTANLAFLAAGARPTAPDWKVATQVTSPADPLWADATTAVAGVWDYYLAILVGSYNANPFSLAPGTYQCWGRLTSSVEQQVLIFPTTLEVA